MKGFAADDEDVQVERILVLCAVVDNTENKKIEIMPQILFQCSISLSLVCKFTILI